MTTGQKIAELTEARVPAINPIIKEFSALAYVGIGIMMFVAILSLTVALILPSLKNIADPELNRTE